MTTKTPDDPEGSSFVKEVYATDQLERCGKWLASIPRDDITVLRQTVEFREFLRAFERLGKAHIRVVVNNNNNNNNNNTIQTAASSVYSYGEEDTPIQSTSFDAADDDDDDDTSSSLCEEHNNAVHAKANAVQQKHDDDTSSSLCEEHNNAVHAKANAVHAKANAVQANAVHANANSNVATTAVGGTKEKQETTKHHASKKSTSHSRKRPGASHVMPVSTSDHSRFCDDDDDDGGGGDESEDIQQQNRRATDFRDRKGQPKAAVAVDHHPMLQNNGNNNNNDNYYYYNYNKCSSGQSPTKTATAAAAATKSTHNNFLRFTDDVLLRIFEFLQCRCLIQTSITCSRFYQLARWSATQRTYDIVNTRQLGNVMQLLRAREQIYCIDDDIDDDDETTNNNNTNNHASGKNVRVPVPVPILMPGRRVLVEDSGDPEFNGVYYCTEYNSNGFVFTKPRLPPRQRGDSDRVSIPHHLEDMVFDNINNNNMDDNNDNGDGGRRDWPRQNGGAGPFQIPGRLPVVNNINNNNNNDQLDPRRQQDLHQQRAIASNDTRLLGHVEKEPLRCFITKSYSTSHLLWYMGKEVETIGSGGGGGGGSMTKKRKKVYFFYAPLLLSGSAPTELHYYPSQTGALLHQNESWLPLSESVGQPPTVEVIDTNDSHFTSLSRFSTED
eukprot:CAMPEP_0172380248 /NCGR_PEP_ID=MMETSP1060-20121228/70341_1 /TAXON_ID=37318 /ORGANISM="Pseudo-nitzschia pungens, Strain cf. cingulata" /LENGTH=667 /DNA_ID=CAMNT_0013108001 /DNA_START=498 /DNA_END=2502 /DNA_ORIENTATION=-